VIDSGVRQEVETALREELPLNLFLAFDVSGSVKGKSLGELKDAALAVVDGLRPGDQAALLTFADTLRLNVPLGSDVARLRTQIASLDAEGGTALVDGTFAALALGDGVGRVVAIVFTDGVETASWLSGADVAETAKQSDVVLYAVHLGDQAARFLDHVTSATGGRRLPVSSPDRLRKTFLDILAEFKARYVLSYTPRGVESKGWHRIDVRVRDQSARVLARKGYMASQ
jgi:VWFA-related protein